MSIPIGLVERTQVQTVAIPTYVACDLANSKHCGFSGFKLPPHTYIIHYHTPLTLRS
jgi:hypothetical protein